MNFNEKYKDYLEEGHYGLSFSNKEVEKYLDDIFQGLIHIPNFKYQQIKLKFGYCRFYTNLSDVVNVEFDRLISDEVEERINKIMNENI